MAVYHKQRVSGAVRQDVAEAWRSSTHLVLLQLLDEVLGIPQLGDQLRLLCSVQLLGKQIKSLKKEGGSPPHL